MTAWARLVNNPDPNMRHIAVNCPVCWAKPGEQCFRRSRGKNLHTRRVVPHFGRVQRFRRRLGLK